MNACQIPANPDIAGIGVRTPIYVQAFLSFIPTVLTVLTIDDRLSVVADLNRVSIITTAATGLLLTGCALLVSAFIQSALYGLTVYHALIVLNLSWLNNLTALSLSIVSFWAVPGWGSERKLAGRPKKGWFGAWLRALCTDPVKFWNEGERLMKIEYRDSRLPVEFMLCTYIAHFSAMGAFGLYVFSNISTFDADAGACAPSTSFYVFGHPIIVTEPVFRRFWLVVYGLAAIPMVNMYLCGLVAVLLGIIIFFTILITVGLLSAIILGLYKGIKEDHSEVVVPSIATRYSYRMTFSFGLLGAIFLDAFLIQSTERMIKGNNISPGESQWSFGQTLAMLLMIPPVAAVAIDCWQFWTRRERKKQQEVERERGFAEQGDVMDELFVYDPRRVDWD